MKAILKFAAPILASVMLLTSCGTNTTQTRPTAAPAKTTTTAAATLDPALKENTVPITITLTTGEEIKAELYPDIAPITVENFTKLVKENFYDGLIFHRVIKGFMIQGGGLDASGTQKQTASIKGEFKANGVENNLEHERGVLSMARTPVMDSASSQFFIMHEDSPHLDGQYAAFGMVTEGMDVVDKIASVQTDASDRPLEDIVIKTITIDED